METSVIDEKAVADLKGRIRGQLLLPDGPAYDEARSLWNGMIDHRPAFIARCLGVADIVTCVNFARENHVLLSIKGGGHNISGLAAGEGGIMLDMCLMRGVWVDSNARRAIAQPGCLLGDVDRETQIHGLGSVLGFISNTGIAGLTVGGGFGYLTRRFGWTSDTLLSVQMVTANGQVVRASETENEDLFWGIRGGGGNFGVVTSFEYKLFPIGPEIVAGAIAWPFDDAAAFLEWYRNLTSQAPPELTCVATLRIAPPAPWLPAHIHGKPIVAMFVCDTGPIAESEKRVAQIKSFRSPVGDIIQRRTYVSQQSLIDATQPKGRRYYWKSEYLSKLDPAMLQKMIEHAKKIPSPHSAILLFPLDGALNRLPEDHSAVGNRDAVSVVNIAASWEKAEEDQNHIEWARTAWRDIRPFSTGGTYINFLTEEEGSERVQAAYGKKNFDKLIEVKTKWDPANFFRVNKNIRPLT